MRCIKKIDKNGFSLLEIVLTIIIIGFSLSAIVESFIVGSAKSVNIVNEETAVNVAKQEMAALNYCRNGGTVNGVCNNITWHNPSKFYTSPQATDINNECFYTTVSAQNVDFTDTNGSGTITITKSPTNYIQTIVKTGWFALNLGGSCSTSPLQASYPSVTVSTIFADY